MNDISLILDDLAGALGRIPEIRIVVAHGSRIRGNQHPASDLDLLIVVDEPVAALSRRLRDREFRRVEEAYGIVIDAHFVALDSLGAAINGNPRFWRLVVADGREIVGSLDEWIDPLTIGALRVPLSERERRALHAANKVAAAHYQMGSVDSMRDSLIRHMATNPETNDDVTAVLRSALMDRLARSALMAAEAVAVARTGHRDRRSPRAAVTASARRLGVAHAPALSLLAGDIDRWGMRKRSDSEGNALEADVRAFIGAAETYVLATVGAAPDSLAGTAPEDAPR